MKHQNSHNPVYLFTTRRFTTRRFTTRRVTTRLFTTFLLIAVLITLSACSKPVNTEPETEAGQTSSQTSSQTTGQSSAQKNTDPVTALLKDKAKGASKEELQKDLDNIAEINPGHAAIWEELIAEWDEVNQPGFVNVEATPPLPADLPDDDTLAIVVLGFQLNLDGTMKDELIQRMEVAKKCAEQYPNAYVVVTGGPTAMNNPAATEADLMAEWLIENGIAQDRIIVENKSRDTAQNALFTYDILVETYPRIMSIALVTSDYHIPVSCLIFDAAWKLTALDTGIDRIPYTVVANAACKTDTPPMDMDTQFLYIERLKPFVW